jgi:hypothetical protein
MSRSQTPTYVARQSRAPPSFQSSNRNVTPISKQVISLEEWERLAPLDEGQLQSINTVKEKFSEREYPENVGFIPALQVDLTGSCSKRKHLRKAPQGVYRPVVDRKR